MARECLENLGRSVVTLSGSQEDGNVTEVWGRSDVGELSQRRTRRRGSRAAGRVRPERNPSEQSSWVRSRLSRGALRRSLPYDAPASSHLRRSSGVVVSSHRNRAAWHSPPTVQTREIMPFPV